MLQCQHECNENEAYKMNVQAKLSATRGLLAMVLFAAAGSTHAGDYPLKPVPFNEVEMTSDFWRPRLETQRKTLVPFAFEKTQPGVEHLQAVDGPCVVIANHMSMLETVILPIIIQPVKDILFTG